MEAVYTARYRINLIFSLFISLSAAAGVIISSPYILKTSLHGADNVSAVSAAAVFLILHLFLTRKYRIRKKIAASEFPDSWETILDNDVIFYRHLSDEDKYLFRKRIQIFIAEKLITGVGTEIDDRTRILIAAAAIIPVFRIEDWEYDNLSEVLVYPDNFSIDYEFSASGNLLGMVVHNTSSMIISKKALFKGFERMEGSNTAIHEFMHKIDEEDGVIDGLPALMLNRNELNKWRDVIRNEVAAIKAGKSDIDNYALTSDAEFFAVAGEYYFEKPEQLKQNHPELYSIMSRIFRQNLGSMIKKEVKNTVVPQNRKQR